MSRGARDLGAQRMEKLKINSKFSEISFVNDLSIKYWFFAARLWKQPNTGLLTYLANWIIHGSWNIRKDALKNILYIIELTEQY